MTNYVVDIELDHRGVTDAMVDGIHSALDDWHVSISESVAGNVQLLLTVPAENLRQALGTGLALAAQVDGKREPLVIAAMPETLRDEREGWVPVPETMSVTQAADLLGITRQAVLQRIESGSIPAQKVGREWRIPRRAVQVSN